MKLKNILLAFLSLTVTAAIAIGGTLAYLTSTDDDVNVMTLGNVKIKQHEYERVLKDDGTYEMITSPKYGEGYKLQEFTQDKPLYPATGAITGWGAKVPFDQIEGASGTQAVFAGLNNVQDKFVLVENTGKSDAYVRTLIALEYGSNTKDIIGISTGDFWIWNGIGIIEADGNNYYLFEAIYKGSSTRHTDGVLPAGEFTYNSLGQVYLSNEATNEDCEALDGNDNGTYDILVFSQAVQVEGFSDAETALDEAFGDITVDNHPWKDGPVQFPGLVYNQEQLTAALEEGGKIKLGASFTVDDTVYVKSNSEIDGNGFELFRAGAKERANVFTGTMFKLENGATLQLENIVLDGGAVWEDANNIGATATGYLVEAGNNSNIILNNGAILQNNDGAHAVSLGTRIGATLTMNGGWIVNNRSGSGAVWGGGNITLNHGSKISNNVSTGSAGAIRMVSNCNLTMNGGEISNNTAAGSGGAIWGYGASTYNLNGGSMSNNTAAAGGAIYTGDSSTINISGDFEMCNNTADDSGALRLSNRTAFNMSGGKLSGNISTNSPAWNGFYGWNPGVNISGGELNDDIFIQGGLTPTVGGNGINGVIHFDLNTNHNTANLSADFGTIKFSVSEGANFSAFNFKPVAGYTYTEGDEDRLICTNSGYETYWDASTNTFRLKAI